MRTLFPATARVELSLRLLLIALSLIAAAQNYLKADRVALAAAGLTVFLLLLPPLLGLLLRVRIPASFRLVYLGFILCAMYLGELQGFFYFFLWWDDFLHTASAMLVTYVGLLLFLVLNRDPELHRKVRPWFLPLAMLCFTIAFGAVWELFEYSSDRLLGVNMLKGRDSSVITGFYSYERALVNTMGDLALDALGALLVSLAAWLHFRRGGNSAFGLLIRDFAKENPRLFRS
jgi:hypothetical protein